MSNKIIELQKNPLIFHNPLSLEREDFKEQRKMNLLFKLNIQKLIKEKKNKNFQLIKDNILYF